MTESFDPDATPPDTGLGITLSRKHALIALGGLAAVAFALAVLNARRKSVPEDSTTLVTDNWQESVNHLASAWDYRYAGMENRMADIERMLRTALGEPEPQYATPVPTTAQAAGITVAPVQANGTHPPVGADEPPPPPPASVSL